MLGISEHIFGSKLIMSKLAEDKGVIKIVLFCLANMKILGLV